MPPKRATEKVLAAVVSDYENYGEPLVYSKLSTYCQFHPHFQRTIPIGATTPFLAAAGQTNLTVISLINPTNIVVLGPPYNGLLMLAATYEIISTAMNNSTGFRHRRRASASRSTWGRSRSSSSPFFTRTPWKLTPEPT